MNKILILPYHLDTTLVDHDYLSEGVLEELIDQVCDYRDMQAVSRSTSLYLHENPISAKELDDKYSVDYLVEGRIKKTGEGYVISTRLLKTKEEKLLFKNSIPLDVDNWMESITEVVESIMVHISQKKKDSTTLPPVQTKAREHYLKGVYHWHRYSYEEMRLAIHAYRQAIKADETFAQPYAGIADCYSVIAYTGSEDPIQSYQKAKEYIQKAIQLNDKRSESYVSAAMLNLFYDHDLSKAKSNLDYALRLHPESVKAHHVMSMYYMYKLEHKLAEKHSVYTLKKEPLAIPHYTILVAIKIVQKNYKEAMEYLNTAMQIEPESIRLMELRGEINLLQGHLEAAIEDFLHCIQQSPSSYLTYGLLSYTYSSLGEKQDSLMIMEKFKEQQPAKHTGYYDYVHALAKLGYQDYDGFFQHIHKTLQLGYVLPIGHIMANPLFSEIRQDSRYNKLLTQFNFINKPVLSLQRKEASYITIHTNSKESLTLDPQDIHFIESEGNYCWVHWYEDNQRKKKLFRVTISQLEKQLTTLKYLYRCHKSYLINLDLEVKVEGNAKGYFFNSPYINKRIPISRSKNNFIKTQYLR